MKIKHIVCCLWCGIRPEAVQSAFCTRDAKRLGIQLIDQKHHLHIFHKSKQVIGWYSNSIAEQLKPLQEEIDNGRS